MPTSWLPEVWKVCLKRRSTIWQAVPEPNSETRFSWTESFRTGFWMLTTKKQWDLPQIGRPLNIIFQEKSKMLLPLNLIPAQQMLGKKGNLLRKSFRLRFRNAKATRFCSAKTKNTNRQILKNSLLYVRLSKKKEQ